MPPLLYIGSFSFVLGLLPSEFQKEDADVVHARGPRMGIEDAHRIIHEASLTPLARKERVFVIAYDDYTLDAQNALLKIIEEPPKTARFILVVDREAKLLPTVRSRLVLRESESPHDPRALLHSFLARTPGERIEEIGKRLQAKNGERDDAWARELLAGLELHARETRNATLLSALDALRPYFDRPGASKKMILEHLTLML